MDLQGYTRVYGGYTRVYKGLQYTCQLFLRYKREIFILGVLGFLKTTRSFPKIPEEVQSLPRTSDVFQSLRDREKGIVSHLFILHCCACSDWRNSKQDETRRILGVSRQTSGWDYFTGRLQESKPRKTKDDGYRRFIASNKRS